MTIANTSMSGTSRGRNRLGLALGCCLSVTGLVLGGSAVAKEKTVDLKCDETSCSWDEKIDNNSTYTYVITCGSGSYDKGICEPNNEAVSCNDDAGADSLTCTCVNSSFSSHHVDISATCTSD